MKTSTITLTLTLCALSIAPATAQQEDTQGTRFQQFAENMSSGDLEKTLQDLQAWEASTPDDPELYCAYGMYYLVPVVGSFTQPSGMDEFISGDTNMLPDTIARFQKLQIQNYYSVKASESSMGAYYKSLEWFQRGLDKHPDVIGLYENLSEAYNKKLEFKYSTKVALEMIDRHKVNHGQWLDYQNQPIEGDVLPELVYNQLNELVGRNEVSLAEILVDSLVALEPQNPSYKLVQAQVLTACYRHEQAQQIYEELYAADSTNLFLIANMANFYSEMNNSERAVALASRISNCGEPQFEELAKAILSKYSTTIVVDGKEVDRSRVQKADELFGAYPMDSLAIDTYLLQWEREAPDDIELYNCRSYFHRRLAEQLEIFFPSPAMKEEDRIKEQQTREKEAQAQYRKALEWLERGLAIDPDRVDLQNAQFENAMAVKDMQLVYQVAVKIKEHDSVPGHKWVKKFGEAARPATNEQFASLCITKAIAFFEEHNEQAIADKLRPLLMPEN